MQHAASALLLSVALLAGCQARGPLDERLYWHAVPEGSRLVLHRDLTIPEGRARVFIQDGRVRAWRDIDEFRPYCHIEVLGLSRPGEAPLVVRAGSFLTGTVTRRYVDAEAGRMLAQAGVLFPGSGRDSNSNRTFNTEIRLHAEQQPAVRKLICGFWGDPVSERHLSIRQIRQVLGPVATLELGA